MRQPIEGRAGSVWRTAMAPLRAMAPAVTLLKRAVLGEYWIEDKRGLKASGPKVEMSAGADIQHADDGTGPLTQRLYKVHINNSKMSAEELLENFRTDPNRFSPTEFAVFDPAPDLGGMRAGEELTVRLPGPWNGPILVSSVDSRSVRLETRQGHMEAGWIQFSTRQENGEVVFQIESLARSGDGAFNNLYHIAKVGKLVQTEMWVRVLESAVNVSGGSQTGRVIVDTTIYGQEVP